MKDVTTEPVSHKVRTKFLLGEKKTDIAKPPPSTMFAQMRVLLTYSAKTSSAHTDWLWTFVCKSLCGHTLSFLWDEYLGVKWLDHMINIFSNFLLHYQIVFKVIVLLKFSPTLYENSSSYTLLSRWCNQSPSFSLEVPNKYILDDLKLPIAYWYSIHYF